MSETELTSQVTVGRYVLHRQIARGGMATIHIARLMGDEGFSRIVAAKRLLPEFAEDSEFVAMFMDEARIASKVHHRNVVPVLDLVTTTDDVMLVQEYVHGVPLHTLLRTAYERKQHIPVRIVVSIAAQVLSGLHAAHETADEMGAPLGIVHRDVSPQNVMVAIDGSARLLDFGVAKATMAAHTTAAGTFKGKLAYSAPEQREGKANRQSDVYALAVVLWELIVGHRLHGTAMGEAQLVAKVMRGQLPSVTAALGGEAVWGAVDGAEWNLIEKLDPIVAKGLAVDLATRWETAADMERALTEAVPPASAADVAAWVKGIGKEFLEGRDKVIAAEEQSWRRAAGSTPGRKSPVPRLATVPGTVRTETARPVAPSSGKTKVGVGVLALLVVVLGVGRVFAMQSNKPSEATSEPAAAKVATPAPVAAPAPAPVAAEPAAAAPVVEQPVAEMPKPEEQKADEPKAEQPNTEAAKPAVAKAGVPKDEAADLGGALAGKPVPKPVEKTVRRKPFVRAAAKPAPEPAAAPVAAPPPAEAPKDDCNPPYYYEGDKKIFKPACL